MSWREGVLHMKYFSLCTLVHDVWRKLNLLERKGWKALAYLFYVPTREQRVKSRNRSYAWKISPRIESHCMSCWWWNSACNRKDNPHLLSCGSDSVGWMCCKRRDIHFFEQDLGLSVLPNLLGVVSLSPYSPALSSISLSLFNWISQWILMIIHPDPKIKGSNHPDPTTISSLMWSTLNNHVVRISLLQTLFYAIPALFPTNIYSDQCLLLTHPCSYVCNPFLPNCPIDTPNFLHHHLNLVSSSAESCWRQKSNSYSWFSCGGTHSTLYYSLLVISFSLSLSPFIHHQIVTSWSPISLTSPRPLLSFHISIFGLRTDGWMGKVQTEWILLHTYSSHITTFSNKIANFHSESEN